MMEPKGCADYAQKCCTAQEKCKLCSKLCSITPAINCSDFQKLTDSSQVYMYVRVFALTFAELVKRSRSDRTTGSLPVLVLPGGTCKSLACLLAVTLLNS